MNDVKKVKEALNQYIKKYTDRWGMFGVIKVIEKSETLYENSFGYKSLEFNLKNSLDTCFTLASISKQFTAFAIMLLVDWKLIELDSKANDYLPKSLKISKEIKIRNLLNHTSGIVNIYNFDEDFFGDKNRLNFSKYDYFQKYINRELSFTPSSKFDYNNSNYNLLAWIIENVSGVSYENFLQENIFKPLEMFNTYVDDSLKIIPNRANNYLKDFDNDVKVPYCDEKSSIGAGGIVSCISDMYKWYQALLKRKLLSDESYNEYFKENLNNYCFGLSKKEEYNSTIYEHGGDNLGIANIVSYDFNNDIFIIILSNNESINQYFLCNSIKDIIHNVKPNDKISLPENKEINIDYNKFCGIYLKDKIVFEEKNNKLYFFRFKNTIHIELYPVENNKFARKYCHQINPYEIKEVNGKMIFWKYTLNN